MILTKFLLFLTFLAPFALSDLPIKSIERGELGTKGIESIPRETRTLHPIKSHKRYVGEVLPGKSGAVDVESIPRETRTLHPIKSRPARDSAGTLDEKDTKGIESISRPVRTLGRGVRGVEPMHHVERAAGVNPLPQRGARIARLTRPEDMKGVDPLLEKSRGLREAIRGPGEITGIDSLSEKTRPVRESVGKELKGVENLSRETLDVLNKDIEGVEPLHRLERGPHRFGREELKETHTVKRAAGMDPLPQKGARVARDAFTNDGMNEVENLPREKHDVVVGKEILGVENLPRQNRDVLGHDIKGVEPLHRVERGGARHAREEIKGPGEVTGIEGKLREARTAEIQGHQGLETRPVRDDLGNIHGMKGVETLPRQNLGALTEDI